MTRLTLLLDAVSKINGVVIFGGREQEFTREKEDLGEIWNGRGLAMVAAYLGSETILEVSQ